MVQILTVLLLLLSSIVANATANCFAHTSISVSVTSPPMNDVGADALIAFSSSYGGYSKIEDVATAPNRWYHFNPITSVQNLFYIQINIALHPFTSTAATFRHRGGSAGIPNNAFASSQVYACKGLNVQDLMHSVTTVVYSFPMIAPLPAGDTSHSVLVPGELPASKPSSRAGYSIVGLIQAGMPGSGYGGITLQLTDTATGTPANTTTTTSAGNYTFDGVANGNYTITPQPQSAIFPGHGFRPPSNNVTVNNNNLSVLPFASMVTQCQASPALSPSAAGDLEFAVFAYSGTAQPLSATATTDDQRFPPATIVGGANGGLQGTLGVTWRVATDTSTFQPQWTVSVANMWLCANVTFKADTSPVAADLYNAPLFHTIVGNGYQCPSNNLAGCVAADDGKPPLQATINWPSDMLWYKHGVPPDKILIFVDNQNNVVRAVNYDIISHTIFGVVIQPGTMRVIAGTGDQTCTGEGGPALNATMAHPVGMAEDSQGTLAIADQQCATIDKIDTNGTFSWWVGGCAQRGTCTGIAFSDCGGSTRPYHGNANNISLNQSLIACPQGVAFDNNDNLLVADSHNALIEIVNTHSSPITAYGVSNIQPGWLVPIVGSISRTCNLTTTAAIPGLTASLNINLRQIAVDHATGEFYFGSPYCEQMAKVDINGNVRAVIGQSRVTGYSPDGTLASEALTANPFRMSMGPNGLLYFTDTGANEIRHIDASGRLQTDVGNHYLWGPKFGYGGGGWYQDDVSARRVMLDYPIGFTFDSTGKLCVSSLMSNIIGCLYYPIPVANHNGRQIINGRTIVR